MSIKVKCKVEKELFKSDNGYRVLSCTPTQKYDMKLNNYFSFTISGGNIPYLDVNSEYEVEIELDESAKYPASYKLISCPSLDRLNLKDLTYDEAFEIMMNVTSSERIAENILKAYPNFIDIILTDGKEAIDTSKVKGMGDAYLSAYSRNLLEKFKYYAMLKKYSYYKLDVNDIEALYGRFTTNDEIDRAIDKTPYMSLIDVCGKSFSYTDKVISEYRDDLLNSEQRLEFAILDVLDRNEQDSSTRINGNEMYSYLKDEYGLPNELLSKVVSVCDNSGLIYYNKETKYLAKMSTWIAENRIADFVKEKLDNSHKLDIDYTKYKEVDGFELSDMQLNCLKNFCEYDISILSGFSGSGKSYSVKNLVRMAEDNNLSYTLLSPTGKASRVLAESTNRKASTIHRKCFQGEIDSDLIVVDEFGMVSIDVMCMLLNSVSNPNCKFVFVGDLAQIASINLGKIFDDMVKSNVIPTTNLTEIFRYKSNGSLFVATNARNGNSFFNDAEMVKHEDNEYTIGKNYKFIELNDDKIIDRIVTEYKKLLDKGVKKENILVLSSMNVHDLGTRAINKAIQEEVNPPIPNEKILTRKIDGDTITFRVGSMVINCKNDYKAITEQSYNRMKESDVLKEDDVYDTFVMNGQIGTIRTILDDGMIVQFDEELIFVSKAKLKNILLAFSISTHKSQGSTTDYTINVISNQHKRMLTRGLLYVADTRNKTACIDIGSVEAYENALRIVDNDLRDTFLLELLKERFNQS